MSIKRHIILVTAVFFVSSALFVTAGEPEKNQPALSSLSTEKIVLLKTPWFCSLNPASLGTLDFDARIGKAYAYFDNAAGSYTLFQDAREMTHTGVLTKGYLPLDKWKFFGSFNYYAEKGNGTRWVDVMEPFSGNPYTVGDSVGGDYAREYFKMEGKAALALSEEISLGIDLQYKAGVGTKRKDPRPENIISRLHILPGILIDLGKLELGIYGRYEGGKEDIEFTSVTGNKFELLYFRGLGAYSMTMEDDGRYSANHLLGGGLQVSVELGELKNVTSFDFSREETDIKRGAQFPLQLVMLEDYALKGSSVFVKVSENRMVNRLKIYAERNKLYGTEPVVEPKAEEIHYQWSTAAKYTLYWQTVSQWGMKYDLYKMMNNHQFDWGISLDARISSDDVTYYFVPESNRQEINLMAVNVNLEKSYFIRKNELIFGLKGGYHGSLGSSLSIVNDDLLLKNIRSDFVWNDFRYRSARDIEAGFTLTFGRNVTMYKSPVQIFVETGYDAISSNFNGGSNRNLFHLNLGINY